MLLSNWFFSLPTVTQILLGYSLVINFFTFMLFGLDKTKAQMGARRTSENALWFSCLIGGSAGGLIGMHVFRHKTKKISFQAVLAIILVIQIAIVTFVLLPTFHTTPTDNIFANDEYQNQ